MNLHDAPPKPIGQRRLLSISLALIASCTTAYSKNHENNDVLVTDHVYKNGLSLSEFETILSSEAEDEFHSRRLSNEELKSSWDAATLFEWERAHVIEKKGYRSRGLSATFTNRFPFIICDPEFQQSGQKSRNAYAAFHSDANFSTIYNRDDKTCFLASSTASMAQDAQNPFVVQPLLPEMKLMRGIVDSLQDYPEEGGSLSVKLCPGYAGSREQSEGVVAGIMEFITSDGLFNRRRMRGNGRSLIGDTFLRKEYVSSSSSSHDRRKMWRSVFERSADPDTSECTDLFDNVEVSISRSGDIVTIAFPPKSYFSTLIVEAESSCLLSLVAALSIAPEVCSISLIAEYKLLNKNAQWITQSGVKGELPFFDSGLSGEGQVVAVSDSGLDVDNCYFANWNVKDIPARKGVIDLNARKVIQYVDNADFRDFNGGHGTHVAGTIAGKKLDYSAGIEVEGKADGIAPSAKIAFFDVHYTSSNRLRIPNDVYDLFNPGMEAGARVHSISWGGTVGNDYKDIDSQFDGYMYENREFLVIVAAGNDGQGNSMSTVASPATGKNCIGVGASESEGPNLNPSLKKEFIAEFSSRGPTSDGRIQPLIVAPGERLTSAMARTSMTLECDENNSLKSSRGTSMSAPVVSGTAALIREYFEKGWYPLGTPMEEHKFIPSGALVKAVLLNGARYPKGIKGRSKTWDCEPYDFNQGFGRLSLIDSLKLKEHNDFSMIIEEQIIPDQKTHEFPIKINTSSCNFAEMSVTLVWMDPPSPSGCQACLLNDLDLSLVKVNNGIEETFLPNGKDSPERMNNVERVRLEEVKHGENYIIRIQAYDLSTVDQEYALVVTGCIDEDTSQSDEDEIQAFAATIPEVAPVKVAVEIPLNYIETNVTGRYKHSGNMFDIRAKEDISITSMAIHTQDLIPVNVEIWTKSGSLSGSSKKRDDWAPIFSGLVQGQGKGKLSPLPLNAFDIISMCSGNLRSFYVTLTKSHNMNFGQGTSFGNLLVSNDDIEIYEGVAVKYPFGSTFSTYNWNGRLDYKVGSSNNCSR